MAVSSGKKGTVPRSLLLLQMCREAYVGLGPSDCALVYDGMADGTGLWGWFAVLIRRTRKETFLCAPSWGCLRSFRHSSVLCSSLDAWLNLSCTWFQKLLLVFSHVTGHHPCVCRVSLASCCAI